ncbi:hypothetical protein M885DRAFT_533333 [Pelagophyceae sp. CCMP2097]|nr:hypothetical protein M885DRAFT_533333 [Pelagophyceae sp. CCMP2097]
MTSLRGEVAAARREFGLLDSAIEAERGRSTTAQRRATQQTFRRGRAAEKLALSRAAMQSTVRLVTGHAAISGLAKPGVAERAFKQLGSSGRISASDLAGALALVLDAVPAAETVAHLLAVADADGDGALDVHEWTALAAQGELFNKQLLSPKYRFLQEAKRATASARGAADAVVAQESARLQADLAALEIAKRALRAEAARGTVARRTAFAAARRAYEADVAALAPADGGAYDASKHRAVLRAESATARLGTMEVSRSRHDAAQAARRKKRQLALDGTLAALADATARLARRRRSQLGHGPPSAAQVVTWRACDGDEYFRPPGAYVLDRDRDRAAADAESRDEALCLRHGERPATTQTASLPRRIGRARTAQRPRTAPDLWERTQISAHSTRRLGVATPLAALQGPNHFDF